MLLLIFRAAGNLYAVDVTWIVEVVPRVDLRRLPHAPDSLAGVFDYRGTVVPVVDLGLLLGAEACPHRLSTRIILVDGRSPDDGPEPGKAARHRWLLGLIAEQVNDVASVKPEQVISPRLQLPQTPYLGAIAEVDHQMVQLINVERILEPSLREAFFGSGHVEPPDTGTSTERNAQAGAR